MATLHIEGSEAEIKAILEGLRGPDHLAAQWSQQERMGLEVVNKLLVPAGMLALGVTAGKVIGKANPDLASQLLPVLLNLYMGGGDMGSIQDTLKAAGKAMKEGVSPDPASTSNHPGNGESTPCECPVCKPHPRIPIAMFLAELTGKTDLVKQLQTIAAFGQPLNLSDMRPGLMSQLATAIKSYPSVKAALLDQAEWLNSGVYDQVVLKAASYIYNELVDEMIGLPPLESPAVDKQVDLSSPNPGEKTGSPNFPPRVVPLPLRGVPSEEPWNNLPIGERIRLDGSPFAPAPEVEPERDPE